MMSLLYLLATTGSPSPSPSIPTRSELTATIIAAHEADAESNFQGWTDATGWTTVTVATPDALRTQVESWRANANNLLRIECNWDGPLDFTTTTLRGPANTSLTANASRLDGYNRPSGGLWIANTSGKTPVFGNAFTCNGLPRVHFDGIGFATKANGGNGDNIINVTLTSTTTFPLYALAAFTNCDIGLTVHRAAEPATEYVKGIGSNYSHTLHIENCRFAGCRDSIQGRTKFLRIWKNHFRKIISDVSTQFSFTTSNWTGHRVWAWLEKNIVADLIDASGFNGLHTDFYQMGTSLDIHAGNSALIRYNMAHMKTSISTDSGSQFVYADDHTNANNSLVMHDNIAANSAFCLAQVHDPSGEGYWYIENNLGMRAGNYLQSGPQTNPRIIVSPNSLAGNESGQNGGAVFIRNNYVTLISNSDALPTTESGNRFHSPVRSVVSGDGLSSGSPIRSEDVFALPTAARDGSDTLTYTITSEDSADYATAYYALADAFEPTAGWGIDSGPSDPETWPGAPARP